MNKPKELKVKIVKLLEFAECGIKYNYPQGSMHDKYMSDLQEIRETFIDVEVIEETKPKVGEKWKVRQDLVHSEAYGGVEYDEGMKRDHITIATIHNYNGVTIYFAVEVSFGGYKYSLEMLDGKIEKPIEGSCKG